jgi:uncharacterized protein with HEPN domain
MSLMGVKFCFNSNIADSITIDLIVIGETRKTCPSEQALFISF